MSSSKGKWFLLLAAFVAPMVAGFEVFRRWLKGAFKR